MYLASYFYNPLQSVVTDTKEKALDWCLKTASENPLIKYCTGYTVVSIYNYRECEEDAYDSYYTNTEKKHNNVVGYAVVDSEDSYDRMLDHDGSHAWIIKEIETI